MCHHNRHCVMQCNSLDGKYYQSMNCSPMSGKLYLDKMVSALTLSTTGICRSGSFLNRSPLIAWPRCESLFRAVKAVSICLRFNLSVWKTSVTVARGYDTMSSYRSGYINGSHDIAWRAKIMKFAHI